MITMNLNTNIRNVIMVIIEAAILMIVFMLGLPILAIAFICLGMATIDFIINLM